MTLDKPSASVQKPFDQQQVWQPTGPGDDPIANVKPKAGGQEGQLEAQRD